MTLDKYLAARSMTLAEFADALGRDGVGVSTVSKWRRGIASPRPRHIQKIALVTRGQVTATDFLKAHVGREPVG
jgi:transcriptional regulator with XRE-family HTH domain